MNEPAVPLEIQRPRTGLAIAALVAGVVATILSFLVIGALIAIVGLVLGTLALRRSQPRGMTWWGIGLSIFGIAASIGFASLYYLGYKYFRDAAVSAAGSTDLDAWEGVVAPDLSTTTLDGTAIRLSELRGKRVLLDFWATWCGPCVREVPHFNRLHQETSRDELVIVGISNEPPEKLRRFMKQHGVTYAIASATDLPAPYSSVRAIPTAFFIDRKGVIQSVVTGYQDFDEMRALALGPDHEGEAKQMPDVPASALNDAAARFTPAERWSKTVSDGRSLAPCDWDGDGSGEIAVMDGGRLRVLATDGTERLAVAIPEASSVIECGRHRTGGVRILSYDIWGESVRVFDSGGREILSIGVRMGVDGAHWGDLDGDGTDEIIIGMNGGGGLRAYSADGKQLWRAKLGNVWNQAVVSAMRERPALVFATEAGGSVKVFDREGKLLRTIEPRGKYAAQMAAAAIDRSGRVQAIAVAEDEVVAFDENGRVAWSTPSRREPGGWRSRTFAHGDIDGDGDAEWVFGEPSGELVIATAEGEKLGGIAGARRLDDFAIVPTADGRGLLVTLESGRLRAFAFARIAAL